MNRLEYDSNSDALYVYISMKKAYHSLEISPRIAVDLTENNQPVGVELLDASRQISELLGRRISKEQIAQELKCQIRETDVLNLDFQVENQKASLGLPKAYESPVLTA
jgi:uncharacterized protein YuzE